MKKKLSIPLVCSLLLVGGLLSACDNEGSPTSALPSEVPTSSTPICTGGNLEFGEVPESIDISLGESNGFKVDEHMTLEGCPEYTVNVLTPSTVKMIGDTIVGTDYGPFEVVYTYNGKETHFKGHVVTKKKLEFNNLVSTIEENFTSYSVFTGLEMFSDKYWIQSTGSDSTLGIATFRGGITHPETKLPYAFNFTLMADAQGEINYTPLVIEKGFGRSKADMGFGAFGLTGDMFEEQIDSDGKPTGYYILKDEADENGYSAIVEPLLKRVSGDYYDQLTYYISSSKIDLAAQINEEGLTLYPVNERGSIILNFTTDSGTFSAGTSISGIGKSGVSSCEDWLLNPTLPEQVNTTALSNYFANLATEKKYTMETYGHWFNPETGATQTTPSSMIFSSGTEMFGNFSTIMHANENLIEGQVLSVDSAIGAPGLDKAPKAGDIELRLISDGSYYYIQGNKKDDKVTWNNTTELRSEGMSNIWETTSLPAMFVKSEQFDIYGVSSFYDYEETEDGKVFHYNANGQDMLLGMESMAYRGIPYFAMNLIDHTLGLQNSAYLTLTGYLYDFTKMSFTISPDGKDLSFRMLFNYSSAISYETGWTIKDVGVDAVSAASKNLYNQIANF